VAISRLTAQDAKGPLGTTASISATYASTPTQNNLLIAVVYSNVTTGSNKITGWSTASDQLVGNNTQGITILYKIAGAGESTTVTATATGASVMRIHIYEYTGNATTSFTDGTNNGNGGASSVSSQTTNSISTTNAADLLFVTCGLGANVTVPAWTNSFNLRQTDSTIRVIDGDLITTATGSYSSAASWTTATKATAIIAAFKAAPIAGAATLSGSGTLSSDSLVSVIGAATVSGTGTLSVAGIDIVLASAPLGGSGTLAADSLVDALGAASLGREWQSSRFWNRHRFSFRRWLRTSRLSPQSWRSCCPEELAQASQT
jgi:hypothetical protein